MPAFCHFFAGITPAIYYDLEDEDRDALRAYLKRWNEANKPKG